MKTETNEHNPDYIFLGVVGVLLLIGIIALTSASSVLSQERFEESYYYLRHQLLYGLLPGMMGFAIGFLLPYHIWKKASVFLLLLSLLLLLMVFSGQFGYEYGGAKRWLTIGGVTFQPSELAKLGLVLYLASWLEKRKKEIKTIGEGLFPFILITGFVGLLILLQPDISTLGIMLFASLFLYFAAGAPLPYIGALVTSGLMLLLLLIKLAPYRLNRITAFLNPESDRLGISYQITQALFAIGSGGLIGKGIGESRFKYSFLPEPMGDSIFAIWAEETGFVGVSILLTLFFLFVWRGLRIASASPDYFGYLLASGLTILIATQAFINIAALAGLLPLTGVTLPFVSYGGTSLVMTLAAVGILANISRHTKKANSR